jgi:hypothetical protein
VSCSALAAGYFFNVPPGPYRVRLKPPPGRRLVCDLDPARTGLKLAWPVEGEDHVYRALAEEGTMVLAARTFCELL